LSQIKERVSAAKPTKEKEELKSRVDNTYKQLKKSKQLWQNPKKRKKLESLEQIEESDRETDGQGLSDQELGKLLGVSNLLIRDIELRGKSPEDKL
jgi:ParB family chromosome partitioning protein